VIKRESNELPEQNDYKPGHGKIREFVITLRDKLNSTHKWSQLNKQLLRGIPNPKRLNHSKPIVVGNFPSMRGPKEFRPILIAFVYG